MINIDDLLLTATITVGQTKQWIRKKDDISKSSLINLVHHYFYNRFIKDLKKDVSGFHKMGVSCSVIEALESYRQGEKDTKGISETMFRFF